MRKLLTILLLLLAVVAQGQMIIRANPHARAQVSSTYGATYTAIYNGFATKPSAATATAQNDMVESLVDGGYWARMDILYICATDATATEAKINWKNPGTFDLTDPGSTDPTWTSLEGFKGDGSTDYLSTNWDPTNNGVNYVLNSATLGVYITEAGDGDPDYVMGRASTARLCPNYGTTYMISTMHGANLSVDGPGTTVGCFMTTRTSATDVEMYVNGTSVASSEANNSVAIGTDDYYILSNSTTKSIAEVSIAFVMDGISDEDAEALNTIFETYMDAIGKGVE